MPPVEDWFDRSCYTRQVRSNSINIPFQDPNNSVKILFLRLDSMNTANATHCSLQCHSNSTDLITTAYNLSFNSLQCLADQVTQPQSAETSRTVWNIIWSSLSTIFACTWVSCHPNLFLDVDTLKKIRHKYQEAEKIEDWNEDRDRDKDKSKRRWSGLQKLSTKAQTIFVAPIKWCWPNYRMVIRAKIVVVALIAPEFIVLWALRQYLAATHIVKRSNGKLTMTHAFFSLMGGFIITDKEQYPICALVPRPIEMLYVVLYGDPLSGVLDNALDDALVAASNKDVFKSVIFKASDEGSMAPVEIDATAEMIADTLATTVLRVVTVDFMNGIPLESLERVLLEATERVLERMELNVNRPTRRSYSQLQTELWNACKDKIRSSIPHMVRNGLQNLSRTIRKTVFSYPEEDIQDRSKRDWLAKTFALAQTAWFVAQCITRKIQHLPLTEIELMTCAYAALSVAIYAFWWHKPFGVEFPVIIRTETPHQETKTSPTTEPNPWNAITLAKVLVGSIYDMIDFQQRTQVPTFYSGLFVDRSSDYWNFIAEIATAAVFGGIHLFAWNYEFPTQSELWIWRVSALVIVVIPPLTIIPISIVDHRVRDSRSPSLVWTVSAISLPILVSLYIIARLSLFTLCLVSLRKLPAGALANVDWLTFIPHID